MTPEVVPPKWRYLSYGDALSETEQRCGSRTHLPVLSVTKSRGPMLASERFGKALHGRDLAKYRVAPLNHIVADPMLLWDGSIGIQRVVPEGLVSPDYRVYRTTDIVDADFMAFVVRDPSKLPFYKGGAKGTNVRRNRIARTDFLAIPLPLPPLPEQRKIAAILSSVDDAIEATQAVIDQLQVVKKAMMAELLTRGLPGRHTRFKQTEIGEVPEGWEVAPLGTVAQLQPGFPFKSSDFSHEGDRLLRGSNVGVGRLDWAPDRTVYFPSESRNAVQDFVLESGDIVVAMDRPFVNEGFKIARLSNTDLPALLLQRVGRFRRIRLSSSYLWAVLHSKFVIGPLKALQKGTDLPHISKAEIESCQIPIPTNDEQVRIGQIATATDARLSYEQRIISSMHIVKTALMSVLLTGEVRVTPDEAVP
jgi:type I restriction enzyme, S subunit